MTRAHNESSPGDRPRVTALAKPSAFGNNEAELELIRRTPLRRTLSTRRNGRSPDLVGTGIELEPEDL